MSQTAALSLGEDLPGQHDVLARREAAAYGGGLPGSLDVPTARPGGLFLSAQRLHPRSRARVRAPYARPGNACIHAISRATPGFRIRRSGVIS